MTCKSYKSYCDACLTAAGCGLHRKFTCATCKRTVAWADGGTDTGFEDACSDCWSAANKVTMRRAGEAL